SKHRTTAVLPEPEVPPQPTDPTERSHPAAPLIPSPPIPPPASEFEVGPLFHSELDASTANFQILGSLAITKVRTKSGLTWERMLTVRQVRTKEGKVTVATGQSCHREIGTTQTAIRIGSRANKRSKDSSYGGQQNWNQDWNPEWSEDEEDETWGSWRQSSSWYTWQRQDPDQDWEYHEDPPIVQLLVATFFLDQEVPLVLTAHRLSSVSDQVRDDVGNDRYQLTFCRRTYLDNAPAGATQIGIPAETDTGGFTHFLLYASSALAEQSTPSFLRFDDLRSRVASLSFVDLDLDAGELGGTISWTAVFDKHLIASYNIYLATSYEGDGRHFTHLVIYAASELAEQTTPVALLLSDVQATVANVSLSDYDLDEHEIGGSLVWDEPSNTEQVTHYIVYFADYNLTNGSDIRLLVAGLIPRVFYLRCAYFQNVSVGNDSLTVQPDTPLINFANVVPRTTHVAIYTLSPLVEQSTPATHVIVDAFATVSGTLFVDKDLDEEEIGGRMAWQLPAQLEKVIQYNVYFAEGADGLNRHLTNYNISIVMSSDGDAGASGADDEGYLDIPPDTALQSFSHLLVYTSSVLVEQSTPDSFIISDTAATVQNISFPDEDLDLGDLGGVLEWVEPEDVSQVTHYMVYLAELFGDPGVNINISNGKQVMYCAVPYCTALVLVAVISGSFSFALVGATVLQLQEYNMNMLGLGLKFFYASQVVDAAIAALGSALGVDPSAVEVQVTQSARRLAQAKKATGRRLAISWSVVYQVLVSADAAASVSEAARAQRADLGAFRAILAPELEAVGVSTSSVLSLAVLDFAEISVEITELDVALAMLNTTSDPDPAAEDSDMDGLDNLTLQERRLSTITGTRSLALGWFREFFAKTLLGDDNITVPPETSIGNYTHFLVYTASSLAEQTTPAALELADESASVSNVTFVDLDLDATDVGGTIVWDPPESRERVQDYLVYFGEDGLGWARSQLHQALPKGINMLPLLPDTPKRNYSHVLVYTRSTLVEQTTPASSRLLDEAPVVRNIRFPDLDLDAADLGGELSWSTSDEALVEAYMVYLAGPANGALCDRVSGVGDGELCRYFLTNASAPESQLDIAPETPLANSGLVLIYLKSSLAEQTTPFGQEINDTIASVSQVSFDDLDVDLEQFGGIISWMEPPEPEPVEGYWLYFKDAYSRSQLSVLSPGIDSFSLPAETSYGGGQIAIYTKSSLVEQTTPVAVNLSDTIAIVGNASFPDFDLDRGDIGGLFSWEPPSDTFKVTHYVVYMARHHDNESEECYEDVVQLAAITGSFTFSVPATLEQVEHAARLAVLAALPGIDPKNLEVTVTRTSRRLASEQSMRRLSGFWHVRYEAAVSLEAVLTTSAAAVALSSAPASFETVMAVALQAAGVSSLVTSASLSVLSFSRLSVDTVDTAQILQRFAAAAAAVAANASGEPGSDEDTDVISNISRRLSSAFEVSDESDGLVQDSDAVPRQLSGRNTGLFSLRLSWCRKFVGSTLEGDTALTIPPETRLANWTHYLVYAASSLAEQSFPRALQIADEDSSVSSVSFLGQDLDFYDLGGRLSWEPPNSTERLAAYRIYLAESASGFGRSQVGPTELAPEVLFYDVPANTRRENFTHFTVFTKSLLVEQTTPAFLAIQDEASRANNVSFVDDDLDEGEIGGNLTWLPAEDDSEVVDYVVYLAEDRYGTNRSLLGNVSRDELSFSVPDNTQLLSFTHLLVFGRSPLEEQTTPSSVVIIETIASVTNVSFTDLDLDAGELGGTVSFVPPTSAERVVSYVAYLSTSFGDSVSYRSQLGSDIVVGVDSEIAEILPDTALANFSQVLVYTKSRLAEQTTPTVLALQDNNASVSSVLFIDLDLDLGDIGGPSSWLPPLDTSLVTHYEVYFSNSTVGEWREHYATLPVGTTLLQIHAEKSLKSDEAYISHFLVYTRSALVEQSTPSIHRISDEFASVSNISFKDLDLDRDEIGGLVSWESPDKPDLVEGYHLYFADSADGFYRSQVDEGVPVNITALDILYDTPRQNFSYLAIYTRSSLVEQTTPVAAALSDTYATVSNVTFADYDLDATDIGG
ncbi:unnamed protein product, partial [Symbiodinium sp. KB8]